MELLLLALVAWLGLSAAKKSAAESLPAPPPPATPPVVVAAPKDWAQQVQQLGLPAAIPTGAPSGTYDGAVEFLGFVPRPPVIYEDIPASSVGTSVPAAGGSGGMAAALVGQVVDLVASPIADFFSPQEPTATQRAGWAAQTGGAARRSDLPIPVAGYGDVPLDPVPTSDVVEVVQFAPRPRETYLDFLPLPVNPPLPEPLPPPPPAPVIDVIGLAPRPRTQELLFPSVTVVDYVTPAEPVAVISPPAPAVALVPPYVPTDPTPFPTPIPEPAPAPSPPPELALQPDPIPIRGTYAERLAARQAAAAAGLDY